jgi:hypothetical protein
MNILNRMCRRALDERGSTAASMGFVLVSLSLVSLMIGATTGVLSYTAQVTKINSVNTVVDSRLSYWASEIDGGATGNESEICYDATGLCVSIARFATNADSTQTVTFALRENGSVNGQIVESSRTWVPRTALRIVGFDTGGLAVWGR